MIVSLIAGVVLIIFAGSLSTWDTTLGTITSHIEELRSSINPIFDEVKKERRYSDDQLQQLKGLDELYSSGIKAMITQASARPEGKSDWNWPSTILRIGVIGMLVFFDPNIDFSLQV